MLIWLKEKYKMLTFSMFSSQGHRSSSSPWTKTECGACLVSWTKKSGVVVSSKRSIGSVWRCFLHFWICWFQSQNVVHLFLLSDMMISLENKLPLISRYLNDCFTRVYLSISTKYWLRMWCYEMFCFPRLIRCEVVVFLRRFVTADTLEQQITERHQGALWKVEQERQAREANVWDCHFFFKSHFSTLAFLMVPVGTKGKSRGEIKNLIQWIYVGILWWCSTETWNEV